MHALTALEQRLIAAQEEQVHREREELERLTATLQALSPLAVLARGYSICRHQADWTGDSRGAGRGARHARRYHALARVPTVHGRTP